MILVEFYVDTYGFSYQDRFYASGKADLNAALAIVSASHMGSHAADARGALMQQKTYSKNVESRGGLSSVQLTVVSSHTGKHNPS